MIYCPECGTANREDSRFCNGCGAALPSQDGVRCPACGTINPAGQTECQHCGADLPQGQAMPRREQQPGPEVSSTAGAPSAGVSPFIGAGAEDLEIPATEGEPEWMAELRAGVTQTPEATVSPPTEGIEPAEIPEWLAALQAEPPAPAPAAEAVLAVPDWLAELEAGAGPEPAPLPGTYAEPTPPVPDRWAEPESAPPEGGAPEEAGTPSAPVFTAEEGLPPLPEQALPDWLVALAPEGGGATTPAPAVVLPKTAPLSAPPEMEALAPAEIPDWLRALQPTPRGEATAQEPPETEGLLEGLRGTIPASRAVEMPDRPGQVGPSVGGAASAARAQLLQELLGRPAVAPKPVAREAAPIGVAILRLVVGLALILAIIAPMVAPLALFAAPSGPEVDRLFAAIQQAAGPDTPVMVAFEYGPAEADEMNRVAEPILEHLLTRGSRLVVVSTRPEGPALATDLIARLIPDQQERLGRVANLGYQPGQTTGVRGLLGDLSQRLEALTGMSASQTQAVAGVRSAADLGLVVVLAAQSDDLRDWVEQVSLDYPDLPVVAGVSARVEPMAAPYLDARSGQLRGMAAGLAGASAYEARLGSNTRIDLYRFHLNSLGLAQLAVVGLMLLGAIVFLAGGRRL